MRVRLLEFTVNNLYGLYNHTVRFNGDENISILHGPNGVGKTALLKSIRFLFSAKLDDLAKIPFHRIGAILSSGVRISVLRTNASIAELHTRQALGAKLEITIFFNDKVVARHSHEPGLPDHRFKSVYWYADGEGIIKNSHVARDDEADAVRSPLGLDKHGELTSIDIKSKKKIASFNEVKEILKLLSVHFVETNRLFRHDVARSAGESANVIVLNVQECAKDLVSHINTALKDYGAVSQKLDQSFPHRFMSEPLVPMDLSELKQNLSMIAENLKDLRSIGLLDADAVRPFDISILDSVDKNKIEIMSLYVRDSRIKLNAFESLLSRIQLLLGSMQQKFRNKRVILSRTRGFFVRLDSGDELPLDALSSGEQHELVLMYELLFKVPAGTLVLIDEPELSLHVSWQKAFLPELLSIAQEVGFGAIVATHSPYIVGERADLMSALDAEAHDE